MVPYKINQLGQDFSSVENQLLRTKDHSTQFFLHAQFMINIAPNVVYPWITSWDAYKYVL